MTIITDPIETRQEFASILEKNESIVIIKLGAEWSTPCKKIEGDVHKYFEKMPANASCFIIDIDESFDLYAYLKSKKVVNGIPALLAYRKGSTNPCAPDEAVIGTDLTQLKMFFVNCMTIYNSL